MRPVTVVLACAAALALAFTGAASAQDRRFGIIEIGGSGVKASVVEIVSAPGEGGPELRSVRDYAVANVNPITPEQQGAVADAVDGFVSDMASRHGLAPLKIYVVGASGLVGAPHAASLRETVNLAIAGRAGAMTYVSANDQARLGFEGVVNCERLAHRRLDALFIDIGSAEITGASVTDAGGERCGDETIGVFSVGFGVKSARADTAQPIAEALAAADEAMLEKPRVYLGGGIVWALATFVQPESGARFVALSASDIEALRNQLAADPLCITDPAMAQRADPQCRFLDVNFSSVADVERRVQASADHREIVAGIFSLDQLRSGADILHALSQRLDLQHHRVYFARGAVRAWALGFLLAEEAGAARR